MSSAVRNSAILKNEPSPHLLRLLRSIEREEFASVRLLRLTAYESRPSLLVQRLAASPLSTDYHIGSLTEHGYSQVVEAHGLTLRGLPAVSYLEQEAREYACEALSADDVDFRPLSGVHAILSSLLTFTEPGDTIFSINPEDGGHFATRFLVERTGRVSAYLPWDAKGFAIDPTEFASQVRHQSPPRAIVFDHGLPLASQPVREIRSVVGPETTIIYDASHTLGLIAAGRFQDPLTEGANVLQGNTHKSFPGVQKALIATRDEGMSAQIRAALSDGLVSSQHTHHSLATYMAFLEMQYFGRTYVDAMLDNAATLAGELESRGALVFGPEGRRTSSHEIFVGSGNGLPAREWAARLIDSGISVNARRVHGVNALRIGVQSITRLGMGRSEMQLIARILLAHRFPASSSQDLRRLVHSLVSDFPDIQYSFDQSLALAL